MHRSRCSSTINNDDCAESDKSGQPTELQGDPCGGGADSVSLPSCWNENRGSAV